MAEKKGRLGGRILKSFAILAILGLVVAAVIVKGFEHGDIKVNTQNLWILHKSVITTGADSKAAYYGQVNPGLAELTSVNSVAKEPGAILESAYGAELFGSDMTMADINLSAPADFAKESKLFKTPLDSTSVSLVEKVIAFYGEANGSVSYSTISGGVATTPASIGRPSSLPTGKFAAAGVSSSGTIYAYSATANKVFAYDTVSSQWLSSSDDVSGASGGTFQLTGVGDKWVLLDSKNGRVWVKGVSGSKSFTPADSAKLQDTSSTGSTAYFSTNAGLYSIDLGSGDIKQVTAATGANSRPVVFEGNVYSGWINPADGQLYNGSTQQLVSLGGFEGGKSLTETPDPVIQTNGYAAVLNDAQSGWAWNISDGSVIPSTQDWKSKIVPPPPVITGGEEAKKQEPPTANDDSFGARPDVLTNLPVILNDTDPNPEDVLTIDPASVSGWDPNKGTLRISADGQSFSLLPTKTVKGSATFSYRVSDGSQAHGALSKGAATVTVSFFTGKQNSAPVWCSDAPTPCSERPAPNANVLPGQSVSVNVVDGFVDPEGDKVFISAAEVTSGTGSVGFNSKGEVVFRSNLSKGASEAAKISVTVSDSLGATATKTVAIRVAPNVELGFEPFVVTTVVNQTKVVDIARGVTGAFGAVNLVEVKAPPTAQGAQVPIVSSTAFSVTSSVAEQLQIAIKFTDENGVPKSSYVQVNVIEDKVAKVAVSPVTVLVRAGLDSTVDLYGAISNPSERSLIISDVTIVRSAGATLSAGKVKGGNMRLRGSTEDQSAGLIGTVTYKVSDGTADTSYSAFGQIFVYQVASASAAPIGVDDTITLRAESTGDIDALANDVGTPGISLALDAKNVTCKGTGFDEKQGIAFAAHGVLRVIAPTLPGTYHCNYTLYASDAPSLKTSAGFTVNVTSKSSNKAPIAPTLKARVTSFATVEVPIPLNGIDPDGDTVAITGVGQSSAGKGFATVSSKGNSVFYTVIPGQEGQDSFSYTVNDGQGGSSVGWVKVGIFGKYQTGGPVTMVDVLDLVAKSNGKAVFDPTANDYDPNGKGLKLVVGSVKPNLKEGTDAYKTSAALIADQPKDDTTRSVTITAAAQASELEFVYSVSDAFGNVSLGSILVRVTNKAVPDNPEVQDTYVDAKQRASLGTAGIDVRTNKVNWLTGDPGSLTMTLVGNTRGFRISGRNTIIGNAPAAATFVVFKLSGKNYANQAVETYGILHIPAESRIINLRDVGQVWEIDEGATADQNVLDWIAIPPGANVEIDGQNVTTSGNGRPEGRCSFKGGTTVTYSAGNGGTKFNDVCVVPIRYVGEKDYSLVPLRIHVKAKNPEPLFNNVTVEVMPGSTATVDLKSMVSWDQTNATFGWKVTHSQGSSIDYKGPDSDVMTFSVVPGSDAREEDQFKVQVGDYKTFGLITVIVGESPNAKPSATLTFDNKSCNVKSGSCALHYSDLTGVVNAFPEPLKFMPFGFNKGTPNYKTGETLTCVGVKIKVTDVNTITATWDVKKGTPTTQTCPTLTGAGALLDTEGKKGSLKVSVDLQGVPLAPLRVEQVGFNRTTVTIRIKAGDFSVGDNAVTEYVVREGGKIVANCERQGDETVTTCPKIEDLRPFHGTDKENLHSFSVTAKNNVGESAACVGAGIYAYEKLRQITSDVIDAHTVLGRETATDMGVLAVTLTPQVDPLAAKYVISGDGGTAARTEVIAGDYKVRNFQISAKPGAATTVTVRAEGAIPAPVQGSIDNSSVSVNVRVSGAPETGTTSAAIIGDSAPYFGKITVHDANRKYSVRTAKVAYVFWPGDRAPTCTFSEPTNTLTVEQVAGAVIKYAEDRAFNDQVSDLTSPDVPGLLQNVTYHAKACYSNGFKVSESIAPNTLSTIQDPNDGDFEYKVELSSSTQSAGATLFSWVVKLAKSQSPGAGMKVQYSSNPNNANDWRDGIYSEYWGAKPVIKVRYCNTAGTICSAGQALVKAQDDTKSWQLRLKRAFVGDQSGIELPNQTCTPAARQYVKFGAEGDGIDGWLGATPDEIVSGQFGAEYQLEGSTTWSPLDSGSYFTVRKKAQAIKKMRFWLQPNGASTSGLDKVQVTIDVNC
ncbi:MAG: Ig-like domain-containing protein [Rhodoluna sp.]|nr:Ig-like domain-containing protein [Rhodoluna sp.]